MTLDELRRAVIDSTPGDWNVITDGPLYLDTFGQITDSEYPVRMGATSLNVASGSLHQM